MGLKPTYGLVPTAGIVENTYTQDHVGPMTNTVAEAAEVLDAVAGVDERDPASMQAAGRDGYRVGGYVEAVESPPDVDSLELGILTNGFGDEVADRVEDRVRGVVETLEDAGASTREVSVENYDQAAAIKPLLSYTEIADHWRAGGAPYRRPALVDEDYQAGFASRTRAASGDLSEFYKSKVLAGAQLIEGQLGRLYTRAQTARNALRDEFDEALDGVDALVTPTTPASVVSPPPWSRV